MEVFGFEISRKKSVPVGLTPVYGPSSTFFGTIRESVTGAWQKNVTVESNQNILAFSAVYACVSLISDDVAKLRIKLNELTSDGIWNEIKSASPFLRVLQKPNRYQTRIQFLSHWITSKLIHGNTYILKERDQRGIVTDLHILDPRLVTPLVASDGSVYYQLNRDIITGLIDPITVPASEIIHDRMITLWHPLIGVTPIYACGASATQGIRIQANSANFFENMSRPGGHLSAPGAISKETLERLKLDINANFSGANLGRVLVTSDGMKFEPMTIPAEDAQLIQQLGWTVQDVARCFHVPLHKIAGNDNPKFSNIAALNQDYYTQTLQIHIEAIELLLEEALSLPSNYGIELDLDGLLRMDPLSRAQQNQIAIQAGYMAPNEARLYENLPPVEGGDTPYLQQQNYALSALSKRDSQADPFASAAPPAPAAPAAPIATQPDAMPPKDVGPAPNKQDESLLVKEFADGLIARLREFEHA